MKPIIAFLISVIILHFSQEALVSQVFEMDSGEGLDAILEYSPHVVMVSAAKPKIEIFKKIIFPKETHYSKQKETVYTEMVEIYEVTEVLKSDLIKKGPVKVWKAPAYGEESVREYHEKNQIESPIVSRYSPKHKLSSGDARILFLQPYKKYPGVFILSAEESVEARLEVEKLIAGKDKKKK